ncbi:hypothetical protein cyc_07508 [Cyclospora cayetanensis]|uniref:Uncharacterized protein n=1 Tax=Cyclospora cayetanensis TaxID=88456 RepID=A0A1D3CZV8_9EIME|nr:hypothetical protein cyc_07508 [Cyclospora cayetanensis]
MADTAGQEHTLSATSQKSHAGSSTLQRMASQGAVSNVMGRTERALRMALGGALIMALTMCDIPTMDYSFKYIGPFLFFVVGTLAPPMLSSAVILLLSGLFCILVACAVATALLSCLLVESGGQALCAVFYALCVIWSSFLAISKTKEMTLIGSYIMLYAVPLATFIAYPYASGGISVEVTPERYAALKEFVTSSSMEEIKEAFSQFFLLSPDKAAALLDKLTSQELINSILQSLPKSLKAVLAASAGTASLDRKTVLTTLFLLAEKVPAGKHVTLEMKLPRDAGSFDLQDWMYEVPLFVDGVSGQSVVIGARPGTWFINALWVASGPIGILRNLIIFAFLGFAVYLLVMLVPPIRRQRDVALREMSSACSTIRKCLCTVQEDLMEASTSADEGRGSSSSSADGKKECDAAGKGGEAPSDVKTSTSRTRVFDEMNNAILGLLEIEKAVLLSGMEPFVLYPGIGVWTMKELNEVRKRLIQCCIETQHMVQLFYCSRGGKHMGSISASHPELASIGNSLLSKCVRIYEFCEALLTTFPCIFSPSRSRKHAAELMDQMQSLEAEMCSLAQAVFRPSEADTERALVELEDGGTTKCNLGVSEPEAAGNRLCRRGSFERAMKLLPMGLSVTAFVQAGYSEPVKLSHSICALSKAQQVNTWCGLLMNLIFPFVSVVVHISRLVIAPLSALAFWRLQWKGPRAWWKHPETWYAVKLVIPLICIYILGIYCKELRDYSWGKNAHREMVKQRREPGADWVRRYPSLRRRVDVTDNPIILDFSDQGTPTRMVPWFLLGYLTVLQTTYSGTVHRGLNRTIGILLGGGDYLVVTRILSNLMGILLALIISHLPPSASAAKCSCNEYSQIMHSCTREVSNLVYSFLYVCGASRDEPFPALLAEDKTKGSDSELRRDSKTLSQEYDGSVTSCVCCTAVFMYSEHEKVGAVAKCLESEVNEMLSSASRLLKEGRHVPLLKMWQMDPSIARVHVAVQSIVLESQAAAQLVSDMLDDLMETTQTRAVEPKELESMQLASLPSKVESPDGTFSYTRSWSLPLMQRGNCLAVQQLFGATQGKELKEALRATCDSLRTLAAACSAQLCSAYPSFEGKLMSFQGGYARQSDSLGGPENAYESCLMAVDNNAHQVTVALVACLGEHCTAHPDSLASRTASAFVIMRLMYHLQSIKSSLNAVHEAAIKGPQGTRVPIYDYWGLRIPGREIGPHHVRSHKLMFYAWPYIVLAQTVSIAFPPLKKGLNLEVGTTRIDMSISVPLEKPMMFCGNS